MQQIIDSIMENRSNDMSIGIAFMINECITGNGTYIDTEMNPFLPPKPVESIKTLVDDMYSRLENNEIIVFGDNKYMNGVQKISDDLIILTVAANVEGGWHPAPGVVAIEKNGNI